MAASVPQGATNNSWLEQGSSEDSKAIELGMSGMSLVSALPNNRPPALSGSSISSAPSDEHHQRHQSFGSISFPNSDLQNGCTQTGTGPLSPSSPLHRGVIGAFSSQNLPKHQGTLTSLLSSNGKNGVTNNFGPSTFVSTPNLYSDGEYEFYGLGRQEVASSPWANVEPKSSNSSSYSRDVEGFDRNGDTCDGLMGLSGIRDRPHTSSAPLRNNSVSSPGPLGALSPLTSDGRGGQQISSDHRRMSRTPVYSSKNCNTRPPLSGHGRDGALNNGSFDARNSADVNFEYSPTNGNSGNTRGEMRSDMADRLQCNTRRGINDQYHFHEKRSVHGEHILYGNNIDHINNFGSLSNVHQQHHSHHQISLQPPHHLALPPGLQELHRDDGNTSILDSNSRVHHHLHGDESETSLFPGGNSESCLYRRGSLPIGKLSRSISDHNTPLLSRSGSLRLQNNDIQPATLQRRHTDFFYNGKQFSSGQQIHPNLKRRDNFGGAADLGAPVMATPEEMRAFNIQEIDDRNRHTGRYHSSSSHGTHIQVPGVTRRHSDLVNMSASAAGRPGGRYVVHNQEIQTLGLDEDLNHPLAGEHIDDPGDDYGIPLRATPPGLMESSHHTKLTYTRSDGSQHTSVHPNRSPYMSLDSIPPTAGSSLPIPRVVYNVKFKRTQRNFIIGPRVTRDLKIGCYVKVEADRGEDLGIVVAKVPAEKFNSAAARSGFRATGSQGEIGLIPTALGSAGISDLKRIIRLATHDEVSLLNVKREEEEDLLKICRGKVRQRALPMHVVDAEYQFDRHKLTFFFEAEGRIDFRELVRDLFSMYKTRIWMQQLDKNGSGAGSTSVTSPLPDYGNSTISQIPVMADNITEPYGISIDPDA